MSRWINAALLILWGVFGVAAVDDDQPGLAPADTPELSTTASLPADELPDDVAVAQPTAALPATRHQPVIEAVDADPPSKPAAAHRARGPPRTLPA